MREVFRRLFRAPPPSQSLFGVFSAQVGPVNADVNVVEVGDASTAFVRLDLFGDLTVIEADDIATAVGAVTITASEAIIEAGDTLAASAELAIVASLAITEGDEVTSATGTLDSVASLATIERSDDIAASANLIVSADLATIEDDDTLNVDALMPIWYPRRGGDDEWGRYERRQIEWERQLRRIINQSWQIVHGEIDPITFLPIQPPDYSAVIEELTGKVKALDKTRVEAFIAEQEELQKEEAISILLIAA